MFIIISGINGIGINIPEAKSITSPNAAFIPFDVIVFIIVPYIIITNESINNTDNNIVVILIISNPKFFGAIN